jgi:hypothetical protein
MFYEVKEVMNMVRTEFIATTTKENIAEILSM